MMKNLLMTIPCHRNPKRCFHINGKPMPICSRCFAMLLGYVFAPITVMLSIAVPIWIPIFMAIPLVIDGFTQRWMWRKSSNPIRFITGLLFGIGQSLFISTIVWTFVKWIV